jgi:homoserine dehydrogenase
MSTMAERATARIGLLGRGTVGGAFADLVGERAAAVEAAAGVRPEISGILRRSEGDFEAILADSDLIVELIGGIEPARDHVLRALRAGKPVVTANKQLVAQCGEELFEAARAAGVQIRYEAAVAGAVPVIRVVQEGHGALPVERVSGIVNGTTNFILSEMAGTGASYEDVLARAQELGYAEADPTEDVNGADAAAKMAILARLAFDTRVSLEDVSYEGITGIRPDDLTYAKELGLSLKLLGVAEKHGSAISVRVFPCFLYRGHPLAPVEGPFNAVTIEGPTISEITISGPGAGGIETASAVLADVTSILAGEAPVHCADRRLEFLDDLESSFYLHLQVADEPGVLARIADVIGRNGISVKSVVQRGTGREASLVMVTHRAGERDFYAALEQISELDFLGAAPRAIRVIEKEYS